MEYGGSKVIFRRGEDIYIERENERVPLRERERMREAETHARSDDIGKSKCERKIENLI